MPDDRPNERRGPEFGAGRPEHASDECRELISTIVRSVIRARRLRDSYFAQGLFADPAWDTLLDLFQAELCGRKVSVSDISIATGLPPTTALRWLNVILEKGLCTRRPDPLDARRIFVELTPAASKALWHYFAELGRASSI